MLAAAWDRFGDDTVMSEVSGDKNLKYGFFINTTFVVLEFAAGLTANSLALISDAVHNLTDSMSIGFSYFASRFSKRRADEKRTYGYGRAAVLAATINASILTVTAFLIYREAVERFGSPEAVSGKIVALLGAIGIISNSAVAYVASRSRKDINARTIFFSNLVDIFSSFSAMVAGLLIIFTGITWIDPVISLLIATLLLIAAWQILRDAARILFEGVPKGLSAAEVKKAMVNHPKVTGVDDLHIWSIGSQDVALSAHVIVKNINTLREADTLLAQLKAALSEKFGIDHATLEPELTAGPHEAERTDEGL